MSVIVSLDAVGVVTVRALDQQNVEVKRIFTGILPPGEKMFTWDGKTEEGGIAPPGLYSIEVKSGAKVIRRQVKIEGEKVP